MSPILWTIGHSTRPINEFLSFLKTHGIQQLIDVRTVPRSRHNPQFNTETLKNSLMDTAINYRHESALGGLRKPKKDSINLGWRNASFRGYADYMQSAIFEEALEKLMIDGQELRTVVMCAEAVPWRCHRSLIADALSVNDWDVRHIMSATQSDRHRLTPFAVVEHGRLYYPRPHDDLPLFQ